MTLRKRVPDEFGIIVPRDNDTVWVQQGGGMTPVQHELEGLYIPIGEGKYNLGYPEWAPEGPNFTEKLREISLDEVDVRDDDLPLAARERGHFETFDEFKQWVENSEQHGWIPLYKDLYRFTYGMFDLLESDPRERWDDVDDLWDAIDESFSFTYETVDYNPYGDETPAVSFDVDEYPSPESAIRWIRITGSKTYEGRVQAEWAEELAGEVVFLMCPNAE